MKSHTTIDNNAINVWPRKREQETRYSQLKQRLSTYRLGIFFLISFSFLSFTSSEKHFSSSNSNHTSKGIGDSLLTNASYKSIPTTMMNTWNMGTGDAANGATITDCTGTFYDSGGPNGNYTDNENLSLTFTPPSGQVIVTFNSTSIEANNRGDCFDGLIIYDGTSNTAPSFGAACGSITPGLTLTSTSGSIHFEFQSDGSVTEAGWDISITNTDTDCGVPSTPVAQADYTIDSGGTINTCAGTFSDAGDLSGDYGDNENHSMTFCSDNEYTVN